MSYLDMKTEIAIGLLLLVLYVTYYLVVEVKVPEVACGDERLRALVAALPAARAAYWPPAWCVQAHAHTVLASLLRSRLAAGPARGWRRQPVPLPDGGEGSLWWARGRPGPGPGPAPASRGALLVVPGLCGDHAADYVRLLLPAAEALRLRLVVYTHRGLAGQPLKSARLYSAVSEADVSAALAVAARGEAGGGGGAGGGEEEGGGQAGGGGQEGGGGQAGVLVAVGVSLGGVLLARHLAAAGARSPLSAAMLVSAPLDVEKGAACVQSGVLNALLSWHMARSLRRTLNAHWEALFAGGAAAGEAGGAGAGQVDAAAALAARSLRQFDAAFTAPHFGFASAEQYYAAASARGLLARIAVPTLALNAADDPYQPREALPWAEARAARRVALVVFARGGHIGFLPARRLPAAASQLLPDLATQYFSAVLARPDLLPRAPAPTPTPAPTPAHR